MKRFAKLLLTLFVALSLFGCGKNEPEKETLYDVIGTTFYNQTKGNEGASLTLYKEGDFEVEQE